MSAEPTQLPMIAPATDLNPLQLLQIAVQRGVDTEQLKQLMELQREWKADKARDAFVSAMNAFRAEALQIVKTKKVSFKDTSYKHATLANMVEIASPALSKHGLSHRWETKQEGPQGVVTVSCIITHELGHSEQCSLTAAPDTSGSKNSIQAIGSTVSYLQRYTFTAITGLAAKDQDDDGRSVVDGEKITEKQAADIEALISEVGADKPAFLAYVGAEKVEAIPAVKFADCVKKLRAKGRQKKAEK